MLCPLWHDRRLLPRLGLHPGVCPATRVPILPACGAEPGADGCIFSVDWSNEDPALCMAGVGEQGHRGRDARDLTAQWLEQSPGRKDPGPCIKPVFRIKPSLGKIQQGWKKLSTLARGRATGFGEAPIRGLQGAGCTWSGAGSASPPVL